MNTLHYTDFPSFILGITEDIWEGRHIDLLHTAYRDDIIVRSPSAVTRGNRAVISATRQTLSEFPDRRLLGEDVIWHRAGDDSWYSSHRLYCTATHLGHGIFGAPTGRRLAYRVIADCHARSHPDLGWQIDDEWLVRDFAGILSHMGMTSRDYAETWCAQQRAQTGQVEVDGFPPESVPEGPYQGSGDDAPCGARYEELLRRIMQDEFAVIAADYDPACQLELPGHVTAHGIAAAERFWLGLRSSFPDAAFRVVHRISGNDPDHCPRAAVRWSLDGIHAGAGMFGDPSGQRVSIMGISHAEFGPRGLKREFILFDEVAVWKQIFAQTPNQESGEEG